ncbi:PHB depolymerase family esterase [uncultured Lentibacter sp.]|uniref:alpha/beta hydrolase family esterase n=1 Tax=uncultured Lentibacter sp. TaxID=1659309 RepID=UPI00262878C2|nr:PHB depolymerase family esterase [uncultured Lentibacter sp.]
MRGRRLAAVICVALLGLAALALARDGETHHVRYAGERHAYQLFVPPRQEGVAPPLLVMLHGYDGSGRLLRRESNIDAEARARGMAVVYPQALKDKTGRAHWNANMKLSRRDDVGYLSALVAHLVPSHGFDPARVFVAGESNGGYMVYTLLCQTQGVFAAGASVMGTMSGADWKSCKPQAPVPVLHVFGTADDVVSPRGTAEDMEGWGGAPEAGQVLWRWAAWNGAVSARQSQLYSDAQRLSYLRADGSLAAELVTLEGMWHDWPAGHHGRADAAALMFDFFTRARP